MSLACERADARRRAFRALPGTRWITHWQAALLCGASALASPAGWAASAQVTVVHDFGVEMYDGEFPTATLTLAADGNLYGVTQGGGFIGIGTVFRVEPGGTVSVVYSFGTAGYPLDDDGKWPNGELLSLGDGFLYGTTRIGGVFNKGTIFRVSPLGAYQRLHDFGSFEGDGADPHAGLIQGPGGYLYGTTLSGGPYQSNSKAGTVYRFSPPGEYAQVYALGASTLDGDWPIAGLALGADGNLYGSTFFGPRRIGMEGGAGTLFRYTPGGGASRIYLFNADGTCGQDGASPEQAMIAGGDGYLYGTTRGGGRYGKGTVFRATPTGQVQVLYSFGSIENDGREPAGKLLQLADGTLLGTTRFGGQYEADDNNGGTVFMLEPDGRYTLLHSFGATPKDGQWVEAGLTKGPDGIFYGTTTNGGATANRPEFAGAGTVYQLVIDPAGTSPTFQSVPTTCANEDDPQRPGDRSGGGSLAPSWILSLALVGLCATRRRVRAD